MTALNTALRSLEAYDALHYVGLYFHVFGLEGDKEWCYSFDPALGLAIVDPIAFDDWREDLRGPLW